MLGRGQHYLVLNKIYVIISYVKYLYNFLSELKNIFHVNGLIRFTFISNQLTIGERPNKKNIESLYLTRKVYLLRLWRGKGICKELCSKKLFKQEYIVVHKRTLKTLRLSKSVIFLHNFKWEGKKSAYLTLTHISKVINTSLTLWKSHDSTFQIT